MKIIVGLGNPGKEYENTRHNSGFKVMDEIAKECGVSIEQKKFKALIATTRIGGEQVMLMKPQTYMNNSGEALIEAVKFYHVDVEDILVIYDDMDMPVGKIRLREKGSAGGQNGVKVSLHIYIPKTLNVFALVSAKMHGSLLLTGYLEKLEKKIRQSMKKLSQMRKMPLSFPSRIPLWIP